MSIVGKSHDNIIWAANDRKTAALNVSGVGGEFFCQVNSFEGWINVSIAGPENTATLSADLVPEDLMEFAEILYAMAEDHLADESDSEGLVD